MELHSDFRDLLAEFADEKVRFLVIGGYAVGHHDRPRYSEQDLLDVKNLERCRSRK